MGEELISTKPIASRYMYITKKYVWHLENITIANSVILSYSLSYTVITSKRKLSSFESTAKFSQDKPMKLVYPIFVSYGKSTLPGISLNTILMHCLVAIESLFPV